MCVINLAVSVTLCSWCKDFIQLVFAAAWARTGCTDRVNLGPGALSMSSITTWPTSELNNKLSSGLGHSLTAWSVALLLVGSMPQSLTSWQIGLLAACLRQVVWYMMWFRVAAINGLAEQLHSLITPPCGAETDPVSCLWLRSHLRFLSFFFSPKKN